MSEKFKKFFKSIVTKNYSVGDDVFSSLSYIDDKIHTTLSAYSLGDSYFRNTTYSPIVPNKQDKFMVYDIHLTKTGNRLKLYFIQNEASKYAYYGYAIQTTNSGHSTIRTSPEFIDEDIINLTVAMKLDFKKEAKEFTDKIQKEYPMLDTYMKFV